MKKMCCILLYSSLVCVLRNQSPTTGRHLQHRTPPKIASSDLDLPSPSLSSLSPSLPFSSVSLINTLLKPLACLYHSLMEFRVDLRDKSNIKSSATASLQTNGNILTNSRWPEDKTRKEESMFRRNAELYPSQYFLTN